MTPPRELVALNINLERVGGRYLTDGVVPVR